MYSCCNIFEKPVFVIDYAHTPDALEVTLQALRAQQRQSADDAIGPIFLITGIAMAILGFGGQILGVKL